MIITAGAEIGEVRELPVLDLGRAADRKACRAGAGRQRGKHRAGTADAKLPAMVNELCTPPKEVSPLVVRETPDFPDGPPPVPGAG